MAFNLTQGSVAWLYVSEVTQDEQSGLCVFMQNLFMLQLTMTFEYKIKSPMDTYGTLWLFSGISLIGGLFCQLVLKESRGLTDKEMKNLFAPKVVPVAPVL